MNDVRCKMEDVRGLTGVGSLSFEHELHELHEFFPKKFGDIKEIAYLCTVKTFKGHEAAAPKKAAYFMHGLKKQAIAAPRGVSDNDPKGTSLE